MKQIKNASDFYEFISSDLAIIDFFAPWCNPCRLLLPESEEISQEQPVKIAKIDVQELNDVAAEFHVASLPTLLFFREGQIVSNIVGLAGKDEILEEIDRITGVSDAV